LIRSRGLRQVLVFCNSKIGAGRLARLLERDGVVASAIHGDKSQLERMQALEAFKRGELEVLVATDVAARGLDIVELPAVINFDIPFNAEDYVHRIGRTGRAGASGVAMSLCGPNERKQLLDIEKLIKRPLEHETLVLERPAHTHERGARRSHGEDDTPRRGMPRGDSRTTTSRYSRPAPPIDDFFLKPYEPSPAALSAAQNQDAHTDTAATRPKKQIAALLGGMPRKAS